MEKAHKRNKIILIIFFLIIIIISINVSLAYLTLIGKEEEDSTKVWTGTLEINYIDGKKINAYNLFPIEEPRINDETYVSTKKFSVTSSGTLDQYINLYIDITKNEFISNHLRYALYDAKENQISTGGIPKEGKILMKSDIFLKSKETKDFTVLLWLMETKENQNEEQDCTFNGEIDILANQIKYE